MHRSLVVVSLTLLAGCASSRVRPVDAAVASVSPFPVGVRSEPSPIECVRADARPVSKVLPVRFERPRDLRGATRPEAVLDGAADAGESAGALDVGLPLVLDLGAGEAPYDDGMPPLDPTLPGPSGFSDALMQFSWREPIGGPFELRGTTALTRVQDLAFVEGLSEARFAWAAVGLALSF